MKVDPTLIHRLFYPQVPLVMAARRERRVSAMPVVSYSSVSDSPPLVSVACAPKAFTCRLAVASGAFSLSILGREKSKAVARLATLSGAKVRDKLAEAGLGHHPGKKLAVPALTGSLATLECTLRSTRKTGDHLLLVASVEAAYASGAFDGFWDYTRYRPLLYAGWRDGLTTYEER